MRGLVELRGEPFPRAGWCPRRLAVGVAADEDAPRRPGAGRDTPADTGLRSRRRRRRSRSTSSVAHLGEHRLERGQVAVHVAERGDAHLAGGRQSGWSGRAAAQTRPGADDVERRTAGTVELARRGHELAGADPADRLRELGLERGHVGPRERRRDHGVGPLEEVVDDLDLVRARAEAGERVDEPLQAIVGLDDLRRACPRRASSSCSRARAPASRRRGGRRAGRAGARRRARTRTAARAVRRRAPRSAAPAPSRSSSRRTRRSAPAPRPSPPDTRRAPDSDVGHRRRRQVDELQQPVHRVADLGRERAPSAPRPSRARAPPASRRRARRSSGRSSARRARARCRRAGARRAAAAPAAPGSVRAPARAAAASAPRRRRRAPAGRSPRRRPRARARGTGSLGRRRRPVDAHEHARTLPLELERRLAGGGELVGAVEAPEHPADRRPLVGLPLGIDGAGDDQAVDRARHRHVVEPQPLGLVLGRPGFLDVCRSRGRRGACRYAGRRRGSRSARRRGRGSRRPTGRCDRGPRRRRRRP